MTENIKAILRPKVRFSQISDNVQKKEVIGHSKEKTALRANGPRIRNIVSLEKPVRIVDPKKSMSIHNKDIPLSNKDISSHCSETISEDVKKISLSNQSVPKIETAEILRNINSIQNIKESSSLLQLDKSSQGSSMKDRRKSLQQKGKENKDTIFKKAVSNKNISNIRIRNSQHIRPVAHEKFKLSTSNNDIQKVNTMDFKSPKMIKSRPLPNIMKKTKDQIMKGRILNIKSVTPNVMPCYKTLIKSKVSPVKKIVLRNVSGSKIRTFVGPGVSRKGQNDVKVDDANKKCVAALDVGELAQPEYNSIVCTINKLKELEQQKIVTDIDHLSSAQKDFVNGKISMALDFPLDEVIYKNLVDLSIDEKHLPSAITRSKDPEPRQRDITPKLSDFFMPEDTKEICEPMHVKPRTLKTDEHWNAFKISDKLLEWKHSMDNME